MRRVLLAVMLVSGLAWAQEDPPIPPSALSRAELQEAIAYGTQAKSQPGYVVKMKPGWSRPGAWCGLLDTPWMRVADEAYKAKREYRTITPADIGPDVVKPEVQIFAMGNPEVGGRQSADDVHAIVIARGDTIIKPTHFQAKPAIFTNGFGARSEGTEAVAIFPLAVLAQDGEVRIVYNGWECRAPFEGGKLR